MKDHDSATEYFAKALAGLRADTPGVTEVVHFNNSGAGLVPRPVLAASLEHLELEARVGGYEAAALREDAVAGFYSATAALIGARPHEIAFAGSATQAYATALSAIAFSPGDLILTTRNDFVSNQIQFLSLRKRFGVEIAHAPDLPGGGVDVEAMAAMMRARRPRLVAATDIPTNSGLVQPVAAIGRHCRELDLLYIVDACQSLGQYPIDVEEIGCDFLTTTCRKYLRGPRGSGVLYASERVLDAGYTPLFVDMRGARWTGPETFEPIAGAGRFEDWEFPYAVLLGCAEAARYAMGVGVDAIAVRSPMLGARLRDGLAALPGVRVLDRGERLSAMVTAAVDGWEPVPFKAALDARRINSALSYREFAVFDFGDKDVDWAIRLSPHYYNTEDEVDAVIAAVAELAR
ncbi:aminotransferase class V [Actinorhabdospora filicis]|uniref:Aminotransferase class V n=1 Tax=Actinorhabdospora filicis TaxID=1785913 RepID=A0A9W6SNR7_9ACTN|nr:aminotransferase class V-fold PLP-dependent enzyme [Actinorhabdospora filicis]GLZ80260.1 aminotransferase class V [Actinorhabdospora filicis]